MNFVMIFGPQAVGKMTVGQELAKQTGMKLLHNHMTIDLLEPFFGFSDEMWRLSDLFREEIFKTASKSSMKGMIFTYVWAFNEEADWKAVQRMKKIFQSDENEIYFVELEASVKTRLGRNRTPNRLKHKPLKRNFEQSEADLLNSMETMRLNSMPGEMQEENYLRLDMEQVSAADAAARIADRFGF